MTLVIQEHINLLPYNTFHFSCIARYFVDIETAEQLTELISHPVYLASEEKLILGGGSNMLFTKDTFDGLVIKNSILGKSILKETDDKIWIDIGAGESRDSLVRRTIDQGRTGLENLVSIPGTVGAAPIQNIGAYGVEVKDTIVSLVGTDMTTGLSRQFTNQQAGFGYRTSLFKETYKEQFVITSVQFRLTKYKQDEYIGNVNYEGVADRVIALETIHPTKTRLRCVTSAIREIRASKLPDLTKIGTAGSFFQNPIVSLEKYNELLINFPELKGRPINSQVSSIKLSAGQLIELIGFKGHKQNNVGVYEHHALVLVHHGNGTGAHLREVIDLIIEKVQTTFSIQLIPEVNIIPHYETI